MNKYGFTDKEWNDVLDILKQFPEIEKAILFGSRAKNTFKPMSDVDIVLYGDKINHSAIAMLQSLLEDSQLPYFFDIIDYKTITSNELKEHIRLYGKIILGADNIPTSDSSDLKFIYYKLISMKLYDYAIGETQPLLTRSLLKDLEINIPPFPEQKAIAAVLSAFDDKIELLREQNQTLETLAKMIYKAWFVRFNFPDKVGKPFRTNDGDIEKYPICFPGKNLLLSLNDPVSSLMSKIQNNLCHIQTLAQTRDTLLPKLMNGNIKLKGFESDE